MNPETQRETTHWDGCWRWHHACAITMIERGVVGVNGGTRACGSPAVFISGPMRGIPDDNRSAFLAAEQRLTELGMSVFNPARNPPEWDISRHMAHDLASLTRCDFVALLPGHEYSLGSIAEQAAAMAIGIPVVELDTGRCLYCPARTRRSGLIGTPGMTEEIVLRWCKKLARSSRGI